MSRIIHHPAVVSSRIGLLTIAVALIASGPARAQTPITAAGLGYRIAPLDGRSAALGGTGLGLLGGTFSLVNPADLRAHLEPGFGLAFSGESVSLKGGPGPLDSGRERFTVIRAVVPFDAWAVGLAFGGEFDQDWAVRFQDTLVLSDGKVPFEEARERDGGISSIDVSVARQLGPISLGVSAQRLNGSVRQTFSRDFELSPDGAPQLSPTGDAERLSYRAWRFKAGGAVTLGDRLMLSAVASFDGTLTSEPEDSTSATTTVDLPKSIQVGGSARLAQGLIVAASGGWAEWSVAGTVEDAIGHDITWMGAGLEYQRLRLLGGDLPVRVGVRRGELPFSLTADAIEETALSFGFGWRFRNGLAVLSTAFEIGSRGDLAVDGLEESFTRATISFELRDR